MLNKNLTNKIMKNVHVLPTEKPSRVYLIKSNNRLGITSDNPEFTENFGSGTQNQNIYITSDEEIKEGDWIYDASEMSVIKCPQMIKPSYFTQFCKKTILTTDQDLIKDGVQAIDDEFLEWFIKNPSCEEVDVKNPLIANVSDFGYKIIIPKEEEFKQELERGITITQVKKKSAVDWLKPKIELMLMEGYKPYPNELEEVFEIAKQMEEEQRGYSEEHLIKVVEKFHSLQLNEFKSFLELLEFKKEEE